MAAVRLAFNPKADFQFRMWNDAAFHSVDFSIERNFFARRIYVLTNGAATPTVRATLQFTLGGRVVYTMPHYFNAAAGQLAIWIASGAIAANQGQADSLIASFGATQYTLFPFNVIVSADKFRFILESSTVPGTAHQFVGIHSQNHW